MRALLLRRSAFAAVLATGLGLTAAAVHGLSGMDTTLQLAAATSDARTAQVSRPWGECDGHRHRLPPLRHRV